MKFNLIVGLCFVLFSHLAQAAEVLDFSIHQGYVSTRALGMGNAFSAVADDHSAMFYNPAALARRKTGQVHLFLRGGISDNWLGLFKDIDDASNAADEITAINNVLSSNYGKSFHSRIPTIGAFWVRPNWGLAFIPADLSNDIGIHQQLGPKLSVNAYLDSTLAYSYAKDIKPKWLREGHRLSWGATAKMIHRIHFADAVDAAMLASDSSNVFDMERAGEGLTFDIDASLYYSPKVSKKGFFKFLQYSKPSFTIVGRNLLDIGYPVQLGLVSDQKDPAKPPHLQRRLDFGSKFDLPNFWVFDPHMSLDIKDVLHRNWNIKKGFHIGAELYWTMFNWWKGSWSVGLNQGYLSAGIGAKLGWFQIDLATWGEETGTESTPTESRRVMVELSLDI